MVLKEGHDSFSAKAGKIGFSDSKDTTQGLIKEVTLEQKNVKYNKVVHME